MEGLLLRRPRLDQSCSAIEVEEKEEKINIRNILMYIWTYHFPITGPQQLQH
jgi:hypothetical protein